MNVAKRITPVSKLATEPRLAPEILLAEQDSTQALDQQPWNLKPFRGNSGIETLSPRPPGLNSKTSSEEGPRASRWNLVLIFWGVLLIFFLAVATILLPKLNLPY